MICEDIMTRAVKFVYETDTIAEAARIMRDHNIGFLPVCQNDGIVTGTVTDRDIVVRLVADTGDLLAPIRDIMTTDVVSCLPKDTLQRIESLMCARRKARIVCLDTDRRPIGVVSVTDIAEVEDASEVARLFATVTSRELSREHTTPIA